MSATRPPDEIERRDDFASRHIGPARQDVDAMLEAVGVPTLDGLIHRTVPASIRDDEPPVLDPALTGREAVEALRARGQVCSPTPRGSAGTEALCADKHWPPVARIDDVHCDRNLSCACPPPEAYEDMADRAG